MNINLAGLREVRCRFGCVDAAVIVHVPEGCVCWQDQIQALCLQHYTKVQSCGPVNILMDMRLRKKG